MRTLQLTITFFFIFSQLSFSFIKPTRSIPISTTEVFSSTEQQSQVLQKSLISSAIFLSVPLQAIALEELSSIVLARPILDIFVNVLSLLFIFRTVISWYPNTNLNEVPFNIIAWPTEPLLRPVRELLPPAFGVDISSIAWVFLLSLFRELVLGQQGILTLLERS